MKKSIYLLLILTALTAHDLFSQLVPIEDPENTVISEIEPVFTCASPYEGVPIARDSGKTWVFENDSWPSYLYFGIDKVTEEVIDGNEGTFPLCDAMVTTTYDAVSSDLDNGIVRLTASTAYPYLGLVPTRLGYEVTDSTGAPVALTDSLGVILFNVSAVGNFNVRVLIESFIAANNIPQVNDACYPGTIIPGNRWYPAVELYDRLQSNQNNVICTSYNRDSSMVFYGPDCISLVAISDSMIVEGSDGGETTISFTVTASSDCANPTSVDWELVHGTTSPGDFSGDLSGTVTFLGDTTAKQLTLSIVKDDLVELDETFTVMLSNPGPLTVLDQQSASGTIVNDDTSRVTISSPFVGEAAGNTPFTISLSKQVDTPVFINFSTVDSTATGDEDFVSQTNSVVAIGANSSFGFWAATIIQDCRDEPDEHFIAMLSNVSASGRAVFIEDPTGVATIFDDDPVDVIDPVASCMDTSLQLGPDGTVSVEIDMVDNGSTDDCVIDAIYFSKDFFTCADIGSNEISMYVVDGSGNIDSCMATVTIIDTMERCWPSEVVYVDSAVTVATTGQDWDHAFTDLDTALHVATLYPNINQIWVAKGTYFPTDGTDQDASFRLVATVSIHGGFASGDTSRAQQDLDMNPTVLSGDIGVAGDSLDNSYHVVVVDSATEGTRLSMLEIRDGNATESNMSDPYGGGVYNRGSLTLEDVVITNCSADSTGSAIYNSGPSATVILQRCLIEGNTSNMDKDVVNVSGAAIEVDGGVSIVKD